MSINFDKIPRYIRQEIDPPKRVVSQGMKNQTVKRIQEWLNYHNCRTTIDADYGPATATCVKAFQRSQSMTPTGRVNKATWEALVAPMKMALTAPGLSGQWSAASAVKAVAEQHLAQHPIEIGGSNEGPWVRLYCDGNDGRAWAWCAGFVSFVMDQAHFYEGMKSPIAGSVSCDTLAAQAKTAGRFVKGSDISRGKRPWDSLGQCSLFLKRRTKTDWTHAGFALDCHGRNSALAFSTIEGNTNDEGSREGYEACQRTRGLGSGNYDFISLQ